MKKNSNYLVLAGDMGIGNWIMLEPIIRYFALKLYYKIIIVNFDGGTPLEYINTLSYVEKIVSIPCVLPLTKGSGMLRRIFQMAYLWGIFRDYRGSRITVFGRHTYSIRNLILGMLFSIKRTYLNVSCDDGKLYIYRLLGFNVRLYESEEHEFNNNIDLGEFILGVKPEPGELYFPKSENTTKSMFNKTGNYVVLQATTGIVQPWKAWPNEYWMNLIQLLVNENFEVLLVGSKAEYDSNQIIVEGSQVGLSTKKTKCITNISGKIDLKGLGTIVKSAACVVSADGVLGHVAACFGTNCISLLGPGGNGRRPLGVSIQCVQAKCDCNSSNSIDRYAQSRIEKCNGKCMLRISPHDVFLRIKQARK